MKVLITGASSGIGEATARVFHEAGHKLVLVARRQDRLKALADEFDAEVAALDVADQNAVDAWFRSSARTLEDVDVLINNAGLALGLKPFQEVERREWDAMIDTNIKGLLAMSRGILPIFLKRNSGHLVHLGSVAGHWNYPKGNVYAATKAAVHALTESMRIDLSGTAIRVTEVSPGMVETEFSQVRFEGDEARAQAVYAGMTPLTARDVAETILWCVSRPARVNIQEVVLYPTDQATPTIVSRRS